MTLAADLAATVCTLTSTPGMVHDPASPLVLGNVAAGSFSVFTHDVVNQNLILQVAGLDTIAEYVFFNDGTITINGQPLGENSEIAAAVLAAQNAAAASLASANSSASSATTASGSVVAAEEEANNAENSALLSADFASAPETKPLPGGGVSSFVSSQRAASVSALSRDLNNGPDVTADELYQPGFLFTERQVTAAGLVTVTIPPNIFSSPDKKQRWGSYRLRNNTGSIKFVAQSGVSLVTAPLLKASAKTVLRSTANTNTIPQNISCSIAVPAVTSGKLVAVYSAAHNGAPLTYVVQAVPSSPDFATWTTLKAYPVNAAFNGVHESAVFTADLTAFAAKTVTVTVAGGNNVRTHQLALFVVSGHGSAGQAVAVPLNSNAVTSFEATLASVPAQSLVIGFGLQRAITTESIFSSFDSNLNEIASLGHDSKGAVDTSQSDTDRSKNAVFGYGQGTPSVAGAFLGRINFTGAVGPGNMGLVAFDPAAVASPSVVLEKEGERDTMSVPFGVAELWFQNDGIKVSLRTPKP